MNTLTIKLIIASLGWHVSAENQAMSPYTDDGFSRLCNAVTNHVNNMLISRGAEPEYIDPTVIKAMAIQYLDHQSFIIRANETLELTHKVNQRIESNSRIHHTAEPMSYRARDDYDYETERYDFLGGA
jgi:hypothetical protein